MLSLHVSAQQDRRPVDSPRDLEQRVVLASQSKLVDRTCHLRRGLDQRKYQRPSARLRLSTRSRRSLVLLSMIAP